MGGSLSCDGVGNIVEVAQSTGAYNPLIRYTYDKQNQLTSTAYYNGTGTADSNIIRECEYTYDTAGNILSESEDGTVIRTYTYGNDQWNDLLTAYNDCKIAYEGQTFMQRPGRPESLASVTGTPVSGNPISYYNGIRWTMEWGHGRNLTSSVTLARSTLVISEDTIDLETALSYTYDAEGIRTGRTHTTNIYGYRPISGNGSVIMSDDETAIGSRYERYTIVSTTTEHYYVTQNGKVVRETVVKNGVTRVLDYIYDESGRPSSLIYKNGAEEPITYYYVLNLQGDVMQIVKADGTAVALYAYDPWGKIIGITNGDGTTANDTSIAKLNSLRYRGYCGDTETQWYYLQSRYYDPITRRFINADSLASTGQGILGTNMFAYCGNNPVVRVDKNGEGWETVWDIISFFASVVDVYNNPSDGWAWVALVGDFLDILVPFFGGAGESVKAYRLANKTADIIDTAVDGYGNLSRAKEFGIKSYKALRKEIAGSGLQAHHIVEQRLVKHLGIDSTSMLCVALTPAEHQKFTNAWRHAFKYGINYSKEVSINDIWRVAQDIYNLNSRRISTYRMNGHKN